MSEKRWVVHYIDGDGSDDFQLLRNNHTMYFTNENESVEFAENFKFKNKPLYWQPEIWKQEKVTTEVSDWKTTRKLK